MPMTPGLVPNIRQTPIALEGLDLPAVEIQVDETEPGIERNAKNEIVRIEHEDGSISISLDGKSIADEGISEAEAAREWFRNLVDEIDPGELERISDDLMRGIADDLSSRKDWIEDRATGIKLLGLKIEIPGLQGASDGAPVEGMSKVRHPLLLEAVLRFQANARSEMLPTDGPVKIRNDAISSTTQQDRLAEALEKDLNHYLTSVASEYYPDTDRMLLMLGFGGCAFKKVFFCPLRNRPVSESVDAEDLIVNNMSTDLRNAKRITHRVFLRPSTVKRLQILGVYRDIDLPTPQEPELDSAQREKNSQQGISDSSVRPDDRDREIYECYCELDIQGFEHKHKGRASGLEIPYRVTIDVSTKQILSIVRNYYEDTQELPEARQNFVKFTFVPGLGFYDIGLLHILGNTTNAITAAWRELLDAGMYANFPGFLMADTGARQNTNIFRVPPGGGALVKTAGLPISQAIMPLPYKEPSQALIALAANMGETGARIGGTAEMAVGEGRQDAPVGTTLALIDQATKVLNAVHKRLHAAQAEEFQLLVKVFREHPETFWQRCKKPSAEWNEQTFLQALDDCQLVPQADPNTASHTQRVMKVMALKQLQAANPSMYDPIAIDTEALKTIGWSNPEQFLIPVEAQGKPHPELTEKMERLKIDKQKADADTMRAQADAMAQGQKLQIDKGKLQADAVAQAQKIQLDQMKAQADMGSRARQTSVDEAKAQAEMKYSAADLENKKQDRLSQERIQLIDLAQNLAVHPESAGLVAPLIRPALDELARGRNSGGV